MKIDLHNHTLYSDGVLSPLELVLRAKKNNVDIFALTDHDSVFGDDEIVEIGKEHNIKVIKGMELSTYYKGDSIHIVCLFKDNIVPSEAYEFSKNLVEKRIKRAIDMMNKVHDIYGLKVDIDGLMKSSKIITRANMMRNIALNNNMTFDEAKFYISDESKAYIPSTKMSVEEGPALARSMGCFCIFAHPCLVKREFVEDVISYGFDGIEVRYANPKNDEEYFTKLAKKYNLLISAGSDCHGDKTHADIGSATLNEEEFAPIAKCINFEI